MRSSSGYAALSVQKFARYTWMLAPMLPAFGASIKRLRDIQIVQRRAVGFINEGSYEIDAGATEDAVGDREYAVRLNKLSLKALITSPTSCLACSESTAMKPASR